MSQVTAFSSLYPRMVGELPLCDDPIMLQALQVAARRLCDKADAWREEIEPIAVVDYQRDYTLSHPYSANISRIRWVKVNGILYAQDAYSLVDDAKLRWENGREPVDLDSCMLRCGAGLTTLATWVAITDGSLTVEWNGATYGLTGISFATATTLADVAKLIENALRAEANSAQIHVRYYSQNTRFVIFSEHGEVGYLTAGTAGTDISGAGHLNGLTGTATLAPYILAGVSFKPHLAATDLPLWFMERYVEAIIGGAMGHLLRMPAPWRNLPRAEEYLSDFRAGLAAARRANDDHYVED